MERGIEREIGRGPDVGAAECEQQPDFRRPASDALEAGEGGDGLLVRQPRDVRKRHPPGGELVGNRQRITRLGPAEPDGAKPLRPKRQHGPGRDRPAGGILQPPPDRPCRGGGDLLRRNRPQERRKPDPPERHRRRPDLGQRGPDAAIPPRQQDQPLAPPPDRAPAGRGRVIVFCHVHFAYKVVANLWTALQATRGDGAMVASNWGGNTGKLHTFIVQESRKTLEAYRAQPNLVSEHANHEEDTARGGYAGRQLFELVQNSADALSGSGGNGNIEIRLTRDNLYCADNGAPIDVDGVRSLMFSHLSPKRGTTEIGRFGLGFKSVLGVTDAPEFLSRSGSFRFDRSAARGQIEKIVPNADRYPVLRLAFAIPDRDIQKDKRLKKLRPWASNVVRLPLTCGAYESLEEQIESFPAEFLLFVGHVNRLTLRNLVSNGNRSIKVERDGPECQLIEDRIPRRWMVFSRVHTLSHNARADRRALDDNDEASIHWAAPLDRMDRPGHFWAFFPTMTSSLVAGILNAPWKTNEDRQNLLRGPYNEELIEAAATLVAGALPALATEEDPGRHLDALPRRQEAGDSEQSLRLREDLLGRLRERDIVPDQDGILRSSWSVCYPPYGVGGAALARWAAYSDRPKNWLHHSAVTRNRLAAVERLLPERLARQSEFRAPVWKWLDALVEMHSSVFFEEADSLSSALEASKAAIQTAALIPAGIREGGDLGSIVLTAGSDWQEPNPETVFLPDSEAAEETVSTSLVHPALVTDADTRKALETLGIGRASAESRFRLLVEDIPSGELEDGFLKAFWAAARRLETAMALGIITREHSWWRDLRVRTRSGEWKPLHAVLLPGPIVPGDGSRDDGATLDTAFHDADLSLLRRLGLTDGPGSECDLSRESWFYSFAYRCRDFFCSPERELPRNPRRSSLEFRDKTGSGPLKVMETLSDEGCALYTSALLALDATYESWTMRHNTQGHVYPDLVCRSPAVEMLKKHGRIRIRDGVVPFSVVLGGQPENLAVLRTLLEHPKAEKIKEAFDLADLTSDSFGEPDVTGEEEPVPLLDEWPGLEDHLPEDRKNDRLIRCGQILAGGVEWECFPYGSNIYLVRAVEEDTALRLIAKELKLGLSEAQIDLVLRRETPGEIQARREEVKQQGANAARVLKAVGEAALRSRLPGSLLAILEEHEGRLTGLRVAEAAIATWHTDTLRHYREHLGHLDPPRQWAGSNRAVAFVEALGFSPEWAGERGSKRAAFEEVDGPFTLPDLHPYQRKIVDRTRALFQEGHPAVGNKRGMISMPTGSGKTRVAVQAVVEALRDDELADGILWVADRDELCEQAVEAWQQVWVARGVRRQRLRISRLWGNQPDPRPTGERHVVVASVQTLFARFRSKPDDYAFLADFALVVFDEAHRSIAPTYTEVMQELGMGGRRRRPGEPFLIGLTATPYRGYNKQETAWLTNRYGRVRLDSGAFGSDDPHEVVAELQKMKVLAEADQREIDGGALSLSDEELGQMAASPWLPQSAENRIARDSERTMRIIEAFETYIEPDWPTLIFATSVEHAQTVAALLSGRGVTARAVSGQTESRTRRRIVEEFRNGDIRALVNYGVFREGFDAPRTRAIVVARPVYSPNLYFQMIGRGLRGRLNGGNDRCLILNVRDNIQNYDRQLAFSDLDWLWGESQRARAA